MGATEDLIVVALTANEEIAPKIIGVIVLIVLPFVGLSKLFVDRLEFDQLERFAAWVTTMLS